MSGFSEYDRYDAVGLAELVRRKEVSASELLSEATTRCDRVNPTLNAVVHRCDGIAEKFASSADTSPPLAGVPFLAKDLGPALAGSPLTWGSRLFARYVPNEDGEIIKRFRAAGLNIFGKTNIPELGLVPVTKSELHGPCRNPWDINRTPGGSSGGAASAVASGIVPVAHASDGGGSIRIPASCCGLVGFKPTRGLNPKDLGPETITAGFSADHVVSRSVETPPLFWMLFAINQTPGFLRVWKLRLAVCASRSCAALCLGRRSIPRCRPHWRKLRSCLRGSAIMSRTPSPASTTERLAWPSSLIGR